MESPRRGSETVAFIDCERGQRFLCRTGGLPCAKQTSSAAKELLPSFAIDESNRFRPSARAFHFYVGVGWCSRRRGRRVHNGRSVAGKDRGVQSESTVTTLLFTDIE